MTGGSRRTSIVHAVHGFSPEFTGGVELYVAALARAEAAAGHRVVVLAGSDEPGEPELRRETVDGIDVARLVGFLPHFERGRDLPRAELLARGLLREVEASLLHIHSWLRLPPNLAAAAAAEGVPAIATLHDLGATCGRIHRLLEGFVPCGVPESPEACLACVRREPWETDEDLRRAITMRKRFADAELSALSALLVPSASHARRLSAVGLRHPAVEILPVALPAPFAQRAPRVRGERPFRFLHFGNLIPAKGTDRILRALRSAPPDGPWELLLLGATPDAPFRIELERLAEGLPVTFGGAYVPGSFATVEADAVVLPSLAAESHSFALDEAFLLGLPLVVSDRGALAERAGGRALVVPADDEAALAAALRRLVDEPGLAAGLAAALPGEPAVPFDAHVARVAVIAERAIRAGASAPDGPTPMERLDEMERNAVRFRARLVETWFSKGALEAAATEEIDGRDSEIRRLSKDEAALRREIERRDVELRRLYAEEAALRTEVASRDGELGRLYAEETALRTELGKRDAELERLYSQELVLRREIDGAGARHAAELAEVRGAYDALERRTLAGFFRRVRRRRLNRPGTSPSGEGRGPEGV